MRPDFLKGWRTHLLALATFLLGLASLMDPELLTTALGLDGKGHAIILISLAVFMFILRQLTTTPAGKSQ
jgi:hypothetical protein